MKDRVGERHKIMSYINVQVSILILLHRSQAKPEERGSGGDEKARKRNHVQQTGAGEVVKERVGGVEAAKPAWERREDLHPMARDPRSCERLQMRPHPCWR
eukprot:2628742-Pyramimonas_sp.AAC.1